MSLCQRNRKAATEQKTKQSNAEVEQMANELGFVARQANPLPTPVEWSRRRFKTGRDIQVNIKGEEETRDELYRIADDIDQPLEETLKRALAALPSRGRALPKAWLWGKAGRFWNSLATTHKKRQKKSLPGVYFFRERMIFCVDVSKTYKSHILHCVCFCRLERISGPVNGHLSVFRK
ncbi:hypothetical protein MJP36_04880 [Pseudomonas palleroniana]|uniref:hypothetical protein n=1 Tax=Pseudomonas palleroniana TaxID=191390 RepID=UPI001FCBDDA5|nr:hypothetical protein [Pseudomonas palleroniana]UOK39203.1 hypothetical protein MJP36_04880 [Pseudomonas palleroniana]